MAEDGEQEPLFPGDPGEEVTLAQRIRAFRADVANAIPEEDHLDRSIGARQLKQDLDRILAAGYDEDHPELELVVEFTQRVTVRPPDLDPDGLLTDEEHAGQVVGWFWDERADLGWDVLNPDAASNWEVLAVRPVGDYHDGA